MSMVRKTTYLVDDLIPANLITLLTGRPNSFKSWVLASLATTAADGGQLFNFYPCERCDKVIYIDEDTAPIVYEQRLEQLVRGEISPSIDQRSMTGFRLNDDRKREQLCSEIKSLTDQGKKVLVLLDSLATISAGLNLDRTENAGRAMDCIKQIRDAGSTVVLAHHVSIHRGGREPMNNTQIKCGVDSILHVEAMPMDDRHIFTVTPIAKRALLTKSFAVEIEGNDEDWAFMRKLGEMPALPTEDAKQVFRLFPDTQIVWTVKEISESTGRDLPESRIRDALAELVQHQCLKKTVNPHDRRHAASYRLAPDFHQLNSVYAQSLKRKK